MNVDLWPMVLAVVSRAGDSASTPPQLVLLEATSERSGAFKALSLLDAILLPSSGVASVATMFDVGANGAAARVVVTYGTTSVSVIRVDLIAGLMASSATLGVADAAFACRCDSALALCFAVNNQLRGGYASLNMSANSVLASGGVIAPAALPKVFFFKKKTIDIRITFP
jgi:hypothetical protein